MAAGVIVGAQVQPRLRSVYVTVTNSDGLPVTDLAPADFIVKEGGREREVSAATLVSAPVQVSIIVDDNGTGIFRSGVASFILGLRGQAEVSITRVIGQPLKIVDFTSNMDALGFAVGKLAASPASPDGGQLLAAIYESAKELQARRAERPIILALTVGGEEHSPLNSEDVLNEIRRSRASLHVVSVAKSVLRATAAIVSARDLLNENLHLQEVLGEGSKRSGGRFEEIVAAAGSMNGLRVLAEELTHQYLVSYTLPAGVRPDQRLSVELRRAGPILRAPTRIDNR